MSARKHQNALFTRLGPHGKKCFFAATKLGTTNKIFVPANKKFAAATKRFVDRTKHFGFVTKYFCYPILTNDFVGITKHFFSVMTSSNLIIVLKLKLIFFKEMNTNEHIIC